MTMLVTRIDDKGDQECTALPYKVSHMRYPLSTWCDSSKFEGGVTCNGRVTVYNTG
jgi:hypothetical protein